MKLLVVLLLSLLPLAARANDPGGGAPGVGANVTLTDNGSTVTLSNGQVSATITKDNAKFTAYTYRGVPLTTSARQIYYSMDGGSSYRQPSGCTYTVKTNTPDMVDIGMRQNLTVIGGEIRDAPIAGAFRLAGAQIAADDNLARRALQVQAPHVRHIFLGHRPQTDHADTHRFDHDILPVRPGHAGI